jgi:hypothetical protein
MRVFLCLICVIGCLTSGAFDAAAAANGMAQLTKKIPPRQRTAVTGAEFAEKIAGMDEKDREQAILDELRKGNLPPFLRSLKPVHLEWQPPSGGSLSATVFVMPDYLAIGSDEDFLRIPMSLHTAAAIACQFGFILPTPKIVDAVYNQSAYHYKPQPMLPGPQMRSTAYYRAHDRKIKEQGRAGGIPPGALVSGHKKDVVIANRLVRNPGKIAIYGWHQCAGSPIQPLSTVHGSCYADYSHGIRLVSDTVWIEGRFQSIYEILEDPNRAPVLSSEGVVANVRELLGSFSEESPDRIASVSGQ